MLYVRHLITQAQVAPQIVKKHVTAQMTDKLPVNALRNHETAQIITLTRRQTCMLRRQALTTGNQGCH